MILDTYRLRLSAPGRLVVAVAGNPNTGKSTVFNGLTGLRVHTGNWPGKTVVRNEGLCVHAGREIVLVDLPGTYSLLANSPEEVIARDFVCFGRPHAAIVVIDATCLERNLNLVLQMAEITPRVVVCLNLVDEASRKGITVNAAALSDGLGLPVVPTVARDGVGLDKLIEKVIEVADGRLRSEPRLPVYGPELERTVEQLGEELRGLVDGQISRRWAALRLIEGDETIIRSLAQFTATASLPAGAGDTAHPAGGGG